MAKTLGKKIAAVAIGTVVGVVILFTAVPLAMWATSGWKTPFDPDDPDYPCFHFRERLIAESGDAALPEWCGEYRCDSGYEGWELILGRTGFFFGQSNCLGWVDLAYGTIASLEGSHLRLAIQARRTVSEVQPHPGLQFRFGDDLYLVPWGDRRYVVPAEQLPEFCALATTGGGDAIRYADIPFRGPCYGFPGSEAPEGLPDVPEAFRKYLPE